MTPKNTEATRSPWSTKPLQVGDAVEIRKGGIKGSQGIVTRVSESSVWVKVYGFDPMSWPKSSVRRVR